MNQWQSLHFFIHDFEQMNHFLTHSVANLPESMRKNYFFIRYWQGGPHIRFRFRAPADVEFITNMMNNYWQEFPNSVELVPQSYYKAYQQHLSDDEPPVWYHNGCIAEIDYQAEFQRYGGPEGTALCERFFCFDSEQIVKILKGDKNQERKSIEKNLFNYCLVFSQAIDEAGIKSKDLLNLKGLTTKENFEFVVKRTTKRFYENKESYHDLLKQYQQGQYFSDKNIQEKRPQYLLRLKDELDSLIHQLQKLETSGIEEIINSLLHMSFNRAGISPFKESSIRYFAYLTLTQLSEPLKAKTEIKKNIC